MLTKKEAISFLQNNQPMQQDSEISNEEIRMYEEVRRYFIQNPDEDCIPLFLNSFGGKDGLGIYQMVEDVLLLYDKEKIMPHLLKAIDSTYEGVKYWGIQIASNFPSECLFEPLLRVLDSEDEDNRLAAITAIAQLALNDVKRNEVISVLKRKCENEFDEDVREFIEEVLEDII